MRAQACSYLPAEHVSGAGSERKTEIEWAGAERWAGVRKKPWSGSGARSGVVRERERSGEQTKLAAQISLKGDMLLKHRNALQTLFYPMSKINYQPEF